jgi:hypothetical protein
MRHLSIPALKVFCFILLNLERNQEEISIDTKENMEEIGYTTRTPIYTGIIELLEKEFIFRKTGSYPVYFINRNKFYNGDRRDSDQFKKK